MLLGLSFGGMSSAHPSVRRGFLAALVLWVLPTLYLAAVCGVRITVPAPGWLVGPRAPRRGNLAPAFDSGRRPDACHFVVEAIEEKLRRQPPGKKGLETCLIRRASLLSARVRSVTKFDRASSD